MDYEEEVLKKINSGNETSSFLPNDVSVNSDNSPLNVTVIPASTENALPPRESNNQRKVSRGNFPAVGESDLQNDRFIYYYLIFRVKRKSSWFVIGLFRCCPILIRKRTQN